MSMPTIEEWRRDVQKDRAKDDYLVTRLCVVAVVVALLGFLIQPYFEMRAFNKFSETKATYWDAMFSQLRITPDK